MAGQKQHGGKRKGAGRKEVADKKVTLTIYPRQSEIEAVGGVEKAKEIALNALKKHIKPIIMKTFILSLFIAIALLSCTEENETIYSVDPALEPYVSAFYTEAAERGVTIPRNLIAELKDIQGVSKADRNQDQNYIYFNDTMFAHFKSAGVEPLIEAHVFYRLGGILLNREISDGVSFMNPDFTSESYKPADKESMFDALFSL